MKRFSFLSVLGVTAIAAVVLAVPAMAGNGNAILDMSHTPVSIDGQTGYNFDFWNGNGKLQNVVTTDYKAVITSSGVTNQVLKGTVANNTGATVTYTANSGGPIPAGQQCWDFNTGQLSPDWTMTINADGRFTLNCHFAKA
jgi:hypothetical protein